MTESTKAKERDQDVPGSMAAFSRSPNEPQTHDKQPQRSECFMIRNFTLCRLLCRFFGCFLIQGLTPGSIRKAKVTLMTSYTLYAVAWVSAVAFFEGGAMANRVARSVRLGVEEHFDDTLSSVVNLIMMVEVATNVSCALLGSGRMLEFFKKCALYEKSSGFRPPVRRDVLRRRHWFLRLCVLAGGVGMYAVVASFYNRPRSDGIHRSSSTAYRLAASAAMAGYIFYDSIAYLFLRSTCGVLVWYLQAQRQALLWVKCAAAHATLSGKSHAAFLTMLISYTVHSSARFFELAFVSQCLRDEVRVQHLKA
ncbi:hypothetical protein HPB52_007580 [Rhipicephalus sanguineus]|uniref:Uncharacterized protein n=1 Tax=Rhipicephalus sanguineus TaxID=34632 RepID=A0A9D4PEB5_RHISA|nr:hypothetical protein HPB52_007580 [Rhipicephalus sanguineus]